MHDSLHISREGRLRREMHCVHDVGECHSLVRKKLLEFMGGITVNPVTCWSTGNGLADLGEIFRRKS